MMKIHASWRTKILGKKLLLEHQCLQTLYHKKYTNKLTRDKETYWVQRYSLGRLETD